VTTVERFNTLAESAVQHLRIVEAGKIRQEVGDGLAMRTRDHFDRILLNGACSGIPEAVTSLLGPGGRLVGALTVEDAPHLVRIDCLDDGELKQSTGGLLRISPLAAGIAATL
jgi:protein-L-isoaspartate(D-aspartate) O-methyltransferase